MGLESLHLQGDRMRTRNCSGVSRRDLLRMGAAGFAGLCASRRDLFSAPKIPIGVQLYSVRHDCEKDLPGTLAAVAKMGYQGVEFAGYYNRDAAALRKLLDDNQLKCCGTHIGLDTLQGEKLARTIEFNKVLGNKFLIVPGLAPERTKSRQSWMETAKIFTEIAGKVKPAGMRVGYHNHSIEFQPLDGEMPWDTFFGNTPKEVVMQVDVGNALDAGADPVAFMRKYPGRAATIHVKEFAKSNPKAYVGEGDVKWKDVFAMLEKAGGTEWYIVEYEVEGVPAIEGIKHCLENLRKMGK
jgi:sugar phosphate isomerase/epimerase